MSVIVPLVHCCKMNQNQFCDLEIRTSKQQKISSPFSTAVTKGIPIPLRKGREAAL